MPTNYDSIDLSFSWNGDYGLEGGDLADTSSDQIQTLLQFIHSIVSSEKGDWELHPTLGTGLSELIGEPNNKSTSQLLQTRVQLGLTSSGAVRAADLVVKVLPVSLHKILVALGINAAATSTNSLTKNSISTALVFDTVENNVSFIDGLKHG